MSRFTQWKLVWYNKGKSTQHTWYKLLITWKEVDHHIFWKKEAEKSNLLSQYLKPRNLKHSNLGYIQ